MTPPAKSLESKARLDPRVLHRKLIEAVSRLEKSGDAVENLRGLLASLVEDPVLPVIGGRLWMREGEHYRLIARHGGRKELPGDYRISADEGILRRVVRDGSAFIQRSDPDYNRKLEVDLGVQDYAAIAFGEEGRYILSFDVTSKIFEDREQIVGFLHILRHVMNRRLDADHYEWIIRETRDIQTSILPKGMPEYRDYDIFGESVPADRERVGGDLFDFIRIEGGNLAAVMADAAGHGLPAALMARDVRTAVHMAVLGEIKPTRMIGRINKVVCDQAPLGRFISLFYGEIDRLNQMIYTAAGHPGVHVSTRGKITELHEGGPVLGIHPEAVYVRGVCRIRPGELICLYTDGVSEARSPSGEILGDERVHETLAAHRDEAAADVVRRLLDDATSFSRGVQEDDRTVVVIRRKV